MRLSAVQAAALHRQPAVRSLQTFRDEQPVQMSRRDQALRQVSPRRPWVRAASGRSESGTEGLSAAHPGQAIWKTGVELERSLLHPSCRHSMLLPRIEVYASDLVINSSE